MILPIILYYSLLYDFVILFCFKDHMIETVNNEDEEFDDSDVGDLMISSPRKMCHHHSNETLTPEILQTISTANNAAGPPQGFV